MTKIREGYKETEIGVIPEDWEVKELNKICVINPESLSAKENPDKEIKYIDIESVSTGRIGIPKVMRFEDSPSRARRKVKKEDVIVSTVRPYLKAFAPVESEEDNLICSTGFAVLRTNQSNYNYKFLFQTTVSDYFINQLLTKMVGSNYPAVNSSDLANTLVTVPPLPEQQRIAEILSTTDSHIEKLDKTIEDYQLLKKGMMKKLLTEGIGHTEFKETEIGRIPKEWEVKKLSEVVDVRDGTHDSPKQVLVGVPLITSKNLKDGKIDLTEITYISEEDHLNISKRSKVDKGDIIFAMIGTIGNPVIIDLDFEFSVKNVALLKFEKSELNNMFLKYLIDSEIVINQFNQRRAGGVQKFVSLGLIRSLEIPIPSTQEQKVISDIFSSLELQINNLKNNKKDFIELKKALMEKLLTGKIRVN